MQAPWILLQAPPPFSGTYVPIYMLQRLYHAADPSKGGSFVFACVKGPVINQERESASRAPRGSSVTYTKGFFGGGYPPSIVPPAPPRLGALAPRDISKEPVLIVTFSVSAARSVKVDLGIGLAISQGGPQRPATAMPLAVLTIDSFEMDADAWYGAAGGIRQKLANVGQITFRQDFDEMRDVREALTLQWRGGGFLQKAKGLDFSGSYVPVNHFKEVSKVPGGGVRITVALLNKARGGPSADNMVLLSSPRGEQLFDTRFFREVDGRGVMGIQGSIKAGSPIVVLDLSLDVQRRFKDGTIFLRRVNADMTFSPVAVLKLDEASWKAAVSKGAVVRDGGMQFDVKANGARIIR